METEPITWASVRAKYARRFGDTQPGFVDDTDIGNAFGKYPAAVISELDKLANAYDAGRVHSPWRAMSKNLDKLARDNTDRSLDSDLRIRQAEAWIRNAGVYCTEHEVIEELFSERGGGRGYSGGLLNGLQDELGPQMLTLWRTERPRGEAAETEFVARAHRNAASYHAFRQPRPTGAAT